jgi:hypothetical protein
MQSNAAQKRYVVSDQPDVVVTNHGNISLFDPKSPEARQWMAEHTEGAQWFGGALVVEHRYVDSFAEALQSDGGFSVG